MLREHQLNAFEEHSRCGLRLLKNNQSIDIYNAFGERVVELNFSYIGHGIFCDTWYGILSEDEYKEIMSGVYLHYFKMNLCRKKLCNTKELRIGMSRDTSEWFVNVLLPQLLQAGLKYNAIVAPAEVNARRSMQFFEDTMEKDLSLVFPTFDIALLWLMSVR